MTWLKSFRNIGSVFHQLLAPTGSHCLTCGKIISLHVPEFPELCQNCYASIAWIRAPRCLICGRHVGCPDCVRADGYLRHFELNRSSVAYTPLMKEWLSSYKFRGDERYGPLLARIVLKGAKQMQQELARRGRGHDSQRLVQLAQRSNSDQTAELFQSVQRTEAIQQVGPVQLKKKATFAWDIVTCVPISPQRMGERGFNQSYVLAATVAEKLKIPFLPLLERKLHTEKQSHKNRYERLHSISNLFTQTTDAHEMISQVYYSSALLSKMRNQGHNYKEVGPLRILLVDDVYTTGSTLNACASVLREMCTEVGIPCEVYTLTWARS